LSSSIATLAEVACGSRAGARVLARQGLRLENALSFLQLPEVAAFAMAIPDRTIILNHLGGLIRVGLYVNWDHEVLATWRSGSAAVADCPKIMTRGGLGMPRMDVDWQNRHGPIGTAALAEAITPVVTCSIEQCGPNRYMCASTVPVDKVAYSYNVLYNTLIQVSTGSLAPAGAAMFYDAAVCLPERRLIGAGGRHGRRERPLLRAMQAHGVRRVGGDARAAGC
jgi:L-fuconolactonase